jgi:D-tyrosyl-tRNA(Tyr) deacylase
MGFIGGVDSLPVPVPWTRLIVLAEPDPVARAVGQLWGTLGATGEHVVSVPVRTLGEGIAVLRRPGPHTHDERLDSRLPPSLRQIPIVFPSIHRSESGHPCLTVHPIGNPGPAAELGGSPGHLVPTAPRLMAAMLRAFAEASGATGMPATYEATHHGPALHQPAFFAEIGLTEGAEPAAAAVQALARGLREAVEDGRDRVAVGIGGGHYAPHFTDLVLDRHWAFGHILSRHCLTGLSPATAESAWSATPGAEGWLFARQTDARAWKGPRADAILRDADAPRRAPGAASSP